MTPSRPSQNCLEISLSVKIDCDRSITCRCAQKCCSASINLCPRCALVQRMHARTCVACMFSVFAPPDLWVRVFRTLVGKTEVRGTYRACLAPQADDACRMFLAKTFALRSRRSRFATLVCVLENVSNKSFQRACAADGPHFAPLHLPELSFARVLGAERARAKKFIVCVKVFTGRE